MYPREHYLYQVREERARKTVTQQFRNVICLDAGESPFVGRDRSLSCLSTIPTSWRARGWSAKLKRISARKSCTQRPGRGLEMTHHAPRLCLNVRLLCNGVVAANRRRQYHNYGADRRELCRL